jgi:galactonate dehydratase
MSEPCGVFNRREWIAAGGLAASLALLDEAVGQDNPAANVYDRTTSIRLTKVTPTSFGPKTLIKLETNHGVTGWGEISQLPPAVAQPLVTTMFELLKDENPTRVEHLWQKMYRSHRDFRGGAFMLHTMAAFDMALWDIAGKLWGVPVYRLLGGPTRDKIRVYPSAKATKIGTGGPHPFSATPREIENLTNMIKDWRKKLGPEGTIMFDAHCSVPPPMLIQLANSIQPYDVLFIEEPAVPSNIEVFKRLKEQIRIPIATGERDRTIYEILPYLQNGCVDIIQPDVCHTGGITQMRKMAILGEAYYTPIAPHCTATEVGVSASFHCTASVPLFLIHEYYPAITPDRLVRKAWTVDGEGNASLPEGPGLGLEIDEARLAELAADPKMKEWKWPGSKAPDGAVWDY